MDIKHKYNDKNGKFYLEENGNQIAELDYDFEDKNTMVIFHTGVNPTHEGKGLGKLLLSKSVEYARDNNYKIVPVCTFAARVFEIEPKYKDVLK